MIHYLLEKLRDFLIDKNYWNTNIVIKLRMIYEFLQSSVVFPIQRRVHVFMGPRRAAGRYTNWITKHEILDIQKIEDTIQTFSYQPKMSIVMPVFHTFPKLLEKAIQSIEQQLYSNWELCIADGGCDKKTAEILQKYCENNSRIKLISLEKNLGIAGNSNQALSLATGEYIVLMDHDDMLAINALYEVVKLLQEYPEADMIYSDEDRVTLKGHRLNPFFKPDWSPDLLLSQNYISHLGVYRRKIIQEIHGFREGFDGAQDYDLVLRFTEKTKNIFHIPKILYHWTDVSMSMSKCHHAVCINSAKKALEDAMKRRNIDIDTIIINDQGNYGIRYKIHGVPLISIIIPTKDKVELLEKCISSIFKKTTYENYEIIVVDNRSEKQETLDYFSELMQNKKIRVIEYNQEFNYSAINNYAIQYAQGEYIVLLNNDTEVITPDWLQGMLELCQRDDVGVVGCKLLFPNNTLQHVGVVMGLFGLAGHVFIQFPVTCSGYFGKNNCIHNLSAVTAACLMTKKSIFQEVGGFNEKDLPIAFNDVDLCLKIRQKGHLVLYTPYTELYHHESASRRYDTVQSERARNEIDFMQKKWHEVILYDPYYNSNLTKRRPDYTVEV